MDECVIFAKWACGWVDWRVLCGKIGDSKVSRLVSKRCHKWAGYCEYSNSSVRVASDDVSYEAFFFIAKRKHVFDPILFIIRAHHYHSRTHIRLLTNSLTDSLTCSLYHSPTRSITRTFIP